MKKVVMIIAPENFRDEELFKPKQIFEDAGVEVTVASRRLGEVTGMLGGRVKVDKKMDGISAEDYDAVIFVGGVGASTYFNDEKAMKLATDVYKEGKIVGAICIAPSVLANAGLLEKRVATCFPSESHNLKDRGAHYTGGDVEQEENIITAKGPQAAEKFARKILDNLENK